MLCCQHGASTLAKILRRPIVSKLTMTSGEKNATFATETMRSTSSIAGRLQNIPQLTRPNISRIWNPQHGIVFGANHGPLGMYRGLSNDAAAEALRNLQLHSEAEDNCVLANTVPTKPQATSSGELTINEDEVAALIEASNVADAAEAALATDAAVVAEPEPEDPEQNELPETPTAYKMNEKTFRAAKIAPKGDPASFWSHTLYRGPKEKGIAPKKPTVHYCRSKLTTDRVLRAYFMDQKVLGFDIEWKSDQKRGGSTKSIREHVSLIQLACEDRIALFHLALYPKGDKIEDIVSPLLKKILEDPEVTKVGVAIRGDCTRVRKHLAIHAQGMFELSHLNKLVKFSKTKDFSKINKGLVSLAKQVQEHLHLPMSKSLDVRTSDWSRTLKLAQIQYAAADSYAGYQLYHTMEMKRKALDPMPPRPYNVELDRPIRYIEGVEIPVDNESEEVEEAVEDEADTSASPEKKKKRILKEPLVEAESIKIEDVDLETADPDADYVPPSHLSMNYSSPNTTGSSSSVTKTLKEQPVVTTFATTSLIETATARTLSHFTATRKLRNSGPRPSPKTLQKARAYFLWHANPHLSYLTLGGILKDPNAVTVQILTSNILDAINELSLYPGDERMRDLLKTWRSATGRLYAPVGEGKFARLERKCKFKLEHEVNEA